MTPRAITGLGIVSASGVGREAFVASLSQPKLLADAPFLEAETFDVAAYPHATVVEVRGFDPTKYLGDKGLRSLDRLTKLMVVAARLALQDAGLKKENAWTAATGDRVGLCASNAYGSLEAIVELDRVAVFEDARYINPAKFPNTVANSAAGYVSIWEDLRALNVAVSDGNCGSLDAVACADVYFETDRADALVVGGAEAMSEPLFAAFRKLGALDPGARLGEGAAFFVFETDEHARARGARPLAHAIGYGTAFDAPEGEAPLIHASPEAMQRAIESALSDARIGPDAIDAVASGVSGLGGFDAAETAAIQAALGKDAPIYAPKAIFGETLGAAGAMGIAAALAWFEGAPPTPPVSLKRESPHTHPAMDSAASPPSPSSPSRPPRTVLVTSMGYYGNASALVLRAP